MTSQRSIRVRSRQAPATPWRDIRQRVEREAFRRAKQVIDNRRNPNPRVTFSDSSRTCTLFFLTPDYNIPTGGIRVIYRHVDILNEAGIDAAVLHQRRGYRCNWFDNRTRVTDIHSSAVGRSDVLVVPELNVNILAGLPAGTRHVVLNQSGHLTWLRQADLVADHYSGSRDLLGIIVVSDHSAELLRHAYPQRTILRVRNGIDRAVFYPPDGRKPRQIACFPRRGSQDLGIVLQLLWARGTLDGWRILPLERLSQAAFADGLRASRIALHLSYQEGFGLPAAEAMACGSYVIGYHGFGGREFMRPEFSSPVETGDVLAVASSVERVIGADSRGEDWCMTRGRLASAFVLDEYSVQRERESIVTAYSSLLAGL